MLHYKHVFNYLCENQDREVYKNKIYDYIYKLDNDPNQTGPSNNFAGLRSKENFAVAINFLENGKLINVQRSGREDIIRLTSIGQEFAKLLNDVKHYCDSYAQFEKIIEEYFSISPSDTPDLNIVKNKLLTKGWNLEDIENYPKWYFATLEIRKTCHKNIFLLLLYRYTLIIHNYSQISNVAKTILIKIFIDEQTNQLLNLNDFIEKNIRDQKSEDPYDFRKEWLLFSNLIEPVRNEVVEIFMGNHDPLSSKQMHNSVHSLFSYLLSVGNIPKKIYQLYIEEHKKVINELETTRLIPMRFGFPFPVGDRTISLMKEIEHLYENSSKNST